MNFIKKTLILALVCVLCISCVQKTGFLLEIPDGTQTEEKPVSKKSSQKTCFYFFTKEQRERIDLFRGMQGSAALRLEISVKKAGHKKQDSENYAELGFFYAEDLKSEFGILMPLSSRPLINFCPEDFEGQTFAVLFSIERGKQCPAGFFVNAKETGAKYSVLSARITEAAVGFDYSSEPEVYAFAPNGGKIRKADTKVDFSGLPLCFPPVNSQNSLMPEIHLSLKNGGKNETAVKFNIGGERFNLRSGTEVLSVPVASLKSPYSVFEITENAELAGCVMAQASDPALFDNSLNYSSSPVCPIKIDPGLLMHWPQKNWRGKDYEIFEWDRFPGILFFDTANYSVQNDFFRRLAFFVEKQGFKGSLLSDGELEGKHGYNAHDYRAYDLARFFEKARTENFPLNSKEWLLLEILLKNGVIVQNSDESYVEGRGAVISISQESPMYLRTTFVAHEGWHGIYFADEEFRNTVSSVFYSLQMADPSSLDFLIKYFKVTPSLNYDTEDEYLLKNEFMAYMLQRPVSDCEKYFTDMAARTHAQSLIKQEADYILATNAAGFCGAAQMLEDYVNRRWNLSAGRVWLLSR